MCGVGVARAVCCAVAVLGCATAFAGGFERDTHDLMNVYEKAGFVEVGVRALSVARDYRKVTPFSGHPEVARGSTPEITVSGRYAIPRFDLKMEVSQGSLDCHLSAREQYGVALDYGSAWIGRTDKVSFGIESDSISLGCAARIADFLSLLGNPGQLRVYGGLFEEWIVVEQQSFAGLNPSVPSAPALSGLSVDDRGIGWRAGLAWWVPESHFLVSLIYTSPVPHRYAGSIDIPARLTPAGARPALAIPVEARADSPRSVQIDIRSPFSETMLGSVSLRWVEWGSLDIIPVLSSAAVGPIAEGSKVGALEAAFRNGYTVDVGLVKKFGTIFLRGGLRWDRGTATGLNPYTHTRTLSGAVFWEPDQHWRLTGGIAFLNASAGHIAPSAELLDRHPDLRVNYTADIEGGVSVLGFVGARYRF